MDYSKLGLSIFPDFINLEEEAEILSHITKSEKKNAKGRNTISRYGSNKPYNSNIKSNNIPEFLDKASQKLCDLGMLKSKPDSVTINEYLIGQGIAPHIDSHSSGEIISVLSLLGAAQMTFTKGVDKFTIDFPARCLVQMREEIRYKWQHSVPPVPADRYSIVFRKAHQ